MTQKQIDKIDKLFQDYHILSKTFNSLSAKYVTLEHIVTSNQKVLESCCSTDNLIERALAHKELYVLVDKLEKITDKIVEIEKHERLTEITLKTVDTIEKDVNKFKLYVAMILGAVTALEVFGILDKVKQYF